MQKADLIISPQWLVTVDSQNRVLQDHSLVIDAGRILDILPTNQAVSAYQATHKTLPEQIVSPGLINAHTHMSMNLLKGYADDQPLMTWLEDHIWPAEARWMSEEYVTDGSRLAIAECLLGGTTCFNDMYFFPDITARIASAAGIRASVGLIVLDFPSAWASGADEYLKKAIRVHDECRDDPLISVTLAPHAPYTVSQEPLKKIGTLSSELDIPIHMHIHETAGEIIEFSRTHNVRPIQMLDSLGLMNPAMIAVHMTQLNEQEIELLGRQGVNVAHCPESNMKLASGGCPVHELMRAGVNVALGTDSTASNNDLDMFGEMRSAALLGKHLTGDASTVNATDTLRMATVNGAKALGVAEETGSLETGKAADLISVDISEIDMVPMYEPVSHLVYAASRRCVQNVWVAGKQLVENRELLTLNQAEITRNAIAWQHRIANTNSI